MTAQWLRHFGCSAPPFSKELQDSALWVPDSRQRVVHDIVTACEERGHVLLTGQPGVGKTCVLRAVRHRLPEAGFRLAYCHNSTLGRRDFYRQLCMVLGLDPKATAAALFYSISKHIQELHQDKVHPVLLLDEAHLTHQQVLDHLHILTNYGWDSQSLLSLVIVGLPELESKLRLTRNRSLWSRIHTRLRLGDASIGDTGEYLTERLSRVSDKTGIFDSDAIALVHEAAGGSLRDIDRIATDAMKSASRRKLKRVDRSLIAKVLDGSGYDDN